MSRLVCDCIKPRENQVHVPVIMCSLHEKIDVFAAVNVRSTVFCSHGSVTSIAFYRIAKKMSLFLRTVEHSQCECTYNLALVL